MGDGKQYVFVEESPPLAVVSIRREPVNAMNAALWEQLQSALDALEANKKIRGVVFASGLDKDIFTAGNDLRELYGPLISEESYARFWGAQNTFLARLYRSPLATAAAIKGACPAGGCILGLVCDFRVQTEEGRIGLNEVALGIPVPAYWAKVFCSLTGAGKGEKLLALGLQVKPREALAVGLIDQVVARKEELMPAAKAALSKLLKAPDVGRVLTKQSLRSELSQSWEADWEREVPGIVAMLKHPQAVAMMERAMSRGKKPKKAAARL